MCFSTWGEVGCKENSARLLSRVSCHGRRHQAHTERQEMPLKLRNLFSCHSGHTLEWVPWGVCGVTVRGSIQSPAECNPRKALWLFLKQEVWTRQSTEPSPNLNCSLIMWLLIGKTEWKIEMKHYVYIGWDKMFWRWLKNTWEHECGKM